VGRSKPREGTGQLDRHAGRNQVFVRGDRWLAPGRYRLRMTVHLTSAYVDGAVILGYTRRDRNIRFTFNAGDYEFAALKRDQRVALDSVDCEMHGVRDAEEAFAGQTVKTTVRFPAPATSFRLEFLIDGPMVLALVNGQEVGSYHSPDAQALEGHVGFAVKSGAIRVEHPTLETYRRRRFTGQDGARTEGLRLEDTGPVTLSRMINRQVVGFDTPPEGALLLWVPRPSKSGEQAVSALGADVFQIAKLLDQKLNEQQLSIPMIVVLPDVLEGAFSTELQAHLGPALSRPVSFLVHRKSTPLAKLDDAYPVSVPMALFVDPHGVVRTMSPCQTEMAILPHDLFHWLSIYRVP
jgi:hypothetical protein